MSNHLIIGLGGTGGKVIRSFRKLVFQQFHGEQPEKINLEYLYIDSDSSMMGLNDPDWKILGKSVQLGKNNQLLISGGADLASHLENLSNYPGIEGWLGDKKEWKDILNFKKAGEIFGGQKRRLGRFLFACKINDFRNQVKSLVDNLQKKGTTATTFHVCCGLAGGTGSGTIIDVVCHLRELYPDDRIILYTLLPEMHPKSNPPWDSGNYHANGYAALMELNALSAGTWQPHDITGTRERLAVSDPFNGCYLFFNQNENGISVDVAKDIPDITADFLFQKLIIVGELNWGSLSRLENAENHDPAPETSVTGTPERSKRFLTFGLKRLAYPEVEIKEYLSYQFARQASLQMLFNNWNDSIGFLDEPKPIDLSTVEDKAVKENWQMTDEYLTLSTAILDEETRKKWKSLSADWDNFLNLSKQNIKDSIKAEDWLSTIEIRTQERFQKTFRQHGVQKFYEIKQEIHAEHAKKIRKNVESEFFSYWSNGTHSLFEIKSLLDALLKSLDKQLQSANDKIVSYQEQADEIDTQKIQANKREWSKIGILSALVGTRNKLLDAQANALQMYYAYLTYVEAWRFAKVLITKIIVEISSLANEVNKTLSELVEINKTFQQGIDERCQETAEDDLSRSLVYYYQPEVVKAFSQRLIKDQSVQKTQTMQTRARIIEQLGENVNFTQLNTRILKQQWLDVIEQSCEQAVTTAHNNVTAAEKDQPRQLNVNLIEKMAKDFSGNEHGLTQYIHDLVRFSGNYLIFNPNEINKKGVGTSSSPTKIDLFTVIRPASNDWSSFVTQLDGILQGSHKHSPEILQNETRDSEITFISITGLFPLRYVKHLEFLKDKYDLRISSHNDAARAKLELHSEGDGTQFPPLYIASEEDVRRDGLPFVLIANAMGIIKPVKSVSTGKSELFLLSKDADGFENDPIPLGETIHEAVDRLNAKNNAFIKEEVELLLRKDYLHIDKQAELKTAIVTIINSIKAECQGDLNAPLFKRFNQAGKQAIKLIKG